MIRSVLEMSIIVDKMLLVVIICGNFSNGMFSNEAIE